MSHSSMNNTLASLPVCDLSKRYVRVRGQRGNGFVEFDFSVGWPELSVELLLRHDDFEAFCKTNRVEMLAPHRQGDANGEPDHAN